ncbi:hypothetical protein KIL84_019524 [Mauremys mutica]|uniref:Uncharacterized protein n=1 Tax=Mauremys mutica TaxID=74926 RepID=A0A9D3XX39_9SAUR|nr:hypothetical protein KIL84_019524 [Mauremys mutica]
MSWSLGFKACEDCGKSMPKSDPHTLFLKCLGESHLKEHCKICRGFRPRTLKDRDQRLCILLMEAMLHPQSDPGSAEPAPSTSSSVCSAPAPRKDSSSDLRHRHGSAHRALTHTSVRHQFQSPVPQKKKRPERDRSPASPRTSRLGSPRQAMPPRYSY